MFHALVAPTCPSEIQLVNGPVRTPTSYITASSVRNSAVGTYQARFDSTAAWCPADFDINVYQPNMYIQVSVQISRQYILPSFFI